MTRIACVSTAVQRAERALGHGEPTETAVADFQQAVCGWSTPPLAVIMARGERGMMQWVMSSVEAGDLDLAKNLPNDHPAKTDALGPMSGLAVRQAHAFLLRHGTRFVEIARLPDHKQLERMPEWDRSLHWPKRGPAAASRGAEGG